MATRARVPGPHREAPPRRLGEQCQARPRPASEEGKAAGGRCRHRAAGWSLFADCTSWHGAIRTAADLTLAARASVGASQGGDGLVGEGRGDLWRSSMSMSLAPYLLAAVSSGRSIGATAEWIEREERDEVVDVLEGVDRAAARAHRMTFTRPDASRSQFLHAMHEILSVYEDPVVAASMDQHDVEPAELLDGDANTLYRRRPSTTRTASARRAP